MTFDPSFASADSSIDQLCAGPNCRAEPVTILDGETITRGMVLGRITASGKFIESLNAATDGSEVARAIAAEDITTSGADGESLAYVEGDFNLHEVTFGTGQTAANTKADLMDVNIYLIDPVTKTPA